LKSATRKSNKLDNITEMTAGYTLSQAIAEASRCLLCYDAPCSAGCPAGTDPGTFIRKLRLRNIKGAVRTIKENNIFGAVCGVCCPVDELCQKSCSATGIERAIEIGKLQRFIVEWGWQTGFDPLETEKEPKKKIKVAVVGSGPAGLTCAAELAKAGFAPTVFEGRAEPGGVLRYGVPQFRLNQEMLDRELEEIKKLGVKIKCNTRIKAGGADKLLDKGFAAVFVAPGIWRPYKLEIPGADSKNVTTATELLEAVRAKGRGQITRMVRKKNVVVIGGGSVAMDVACTCKGLGADRVYCICLEGLAEIPADEADLKLALDNHVVIKPQCQVTEILGKGGRVTGVAGTETEWIEPDSFVPQNARAVPDTEFRLKADAVVMAIGSGPEPENRELSARIKYGKGGLIRTRKDGVSMADKKIFAGGDATRGPALIVNAVADGKEAARKIIKTLGTSK
jgi:NADPH-dependent glutamate synthase beta subunit-like oxidoreductase